MTWYKHLLWLTVGVLFLLEGALLPWIIPSTASDWKLMIIPHFSWVTILFVAIYLNRHMAITMALVFGILHDIIYYGHVLGAYAFGMGVTTYVIALMLRDTHVSWYTGIGSIALGLIMFEGIVFGLYTLFQIASVAPTWYLLHAVLPTLLLNICFASAIYYPAIKIFARIEKYVAPTEPEAYPTGNP